MTGYQQVSWSTGWQLYGPQNHIKFHAKQALDIIFACWSLLFTTIIIIHILLNFESTKFRSHNLNFHNSQFLNYFFFSIFSFFKDDQEKPNPLVATPFTEFVRMDRRRIRFAFHPGLQKICR